MRSAAGKSCAPVEAKPCLWSGRKIHPDDLRVCELTGLPIHFEYVTANNNPRLQPLADLLNGIKRTSDEPHLWPMVTTEVAEDEGPPEIRRTGPFLYLRLRRHDYRPVELATWLDRLEPFVSDGLDAYVFFRHDEVGRGGELALELAELATARWPASAVSPR